MSRKTFALAVARTRSQEHALTQCGYVDGELFRQLRSEAERGGVIAPGSRPATVACVVNEKLIVNVASDDAQERQGSLALSLLQREDLRVNTGDPVSLRLATMPFRRAAKLKLELSPFKKQDPICLELAELSAAVLRNLCGLAVMTYGRYVYRFRDKIDTAKDVDVRVRALLVDCGDKMKGVRGAALEQFGGLVTDGTVLEFVVAEGCRNLTVSGLDSTSAHRQVLLNNFDVTKMGVGGLSKEFEEVFRRVLLTRMYSPKFLREIGVQHVKGVILFGPPGTGKTLIARKLGEALNTKNITVVNGPELFDKFVGESESKTRALFAEAEADEKKFGDESPLHIIIFDEMDAICRTRGSSTGGTNVGDSVVNQLLTKIDGVNQLNNVLLIGMTNRFDLLDDAILRPGRFEVHITITLPDLAGRLEILEIHTKKLRESGRLAATVDLPALAEYTENYSGAELSAVVRAAVSHALRREVDTDTLKVTEETVIVSPEDLEKGLKDVQPGHGVPVRVLESYKRHGIIVFSPDFAELQSALTSLAVDFRNSEGLTNCSVLLYGRPGAGKTALAAHIARESKYPFVRVVTPSQLTGTESERIAKLKGVFAAARGSNVSMVILDSIDLMLEYTPVGMRFLNGVLSYFKCVLTEVLVDVKKTLVIATTSSLETLNALQLTSYFDNKMKVSSVSSSRSVELVLRSLARGADETQPPTMTDSEILAFTLKIENSIPIRDYIVAFKLEEARAREGGGTVSADGLRKRLDRMVTSR